MARPKEAPAWGEPVAGGGKGGAKASPASKHRKQTDDLRRRENVLRPCAFLGSQHIRGGQGNDGQKGAQGRAESGRQELREIITENEGQQGDRTGLNDRHPRPPKKEGDIFPESAGQVMVIAAGMGIGGGELGIAQGPDQGHDSSQDPGKEKSAVTPRIGRNERGRLEDARPDDNADYQRDAVDEGKRLFGYRRFFLHTVQSDPDKNLLLIRYR